MTSCGATRYTRAPPSVQEPRVADRPAQALLHLLERHPSPVHESRLPARGRPTRGRLSASAVIPVCLRVHEADHGHPWWDPHRPQNESGPADVRLHRLHEGWCPVAMRGRRALPAEPVVEGGRLPQSEDEALQRLAEAIDALDAARAAHAARWSRGDQRPPQDLCGSRRRRHQGRGGDDPAWRSPGAREVRLRAGGLRRQGELGLPAGHRLRRRGHVVVEGRRRRRRAGPRCSRRCSVQSP